MAHVFISYVHENLDVVRRISDVLSSFGITVWLDTDSIKAGSRWKDAIREGISRGAFFIACFSAAYSDRSKTYMNEELTLAIEELRQRPTDQSWFIPVLLDDVAIPDRMIGGGEKLSDLQNVALFRDWTDGIRRILAVIQPISSMEFTLRDALKDSSARARITAADSLAKMGRTARESASALLELLDDENETVRAAGAAALGQIGEASREIVFKLLEITPDNGHPYYPSKHANDALVKIGADAVPFLIEALSRDGGGRNSIGEAAAKTLAQIGESALPYLAAAMKTADEGSKTLIADVIADMRPTSHSPESNASRTLVQDLIQTLSSQSESRASAADALGALQDPAAVPALIEALSDPNYVCVCAANALAQIKDSRAVEPLVGVLQDTNKFWVPRGAAAVALGRLGKLAESALPALRNALQYDCTNENDEKWDLRAREAVEDAILHITNPSAECSLKGRGYRFEMWGMY